MAVHLDKGWALYMSVQAVPKSSMLLFQEYYLVEKNSSSIYNTHHNTDNSVHF